MERKRMHEEKENEKKIKTQRFPWSWHDLAARELYNLFKPASHHAARVVHSSRLPACFLSKEAREDKDDQNTSFVKWDEPPV